MNHELHTSPDRRIAKPGETRVGRCGFVGAAMAVSVLSLRASLSLHNGVIAPQ